MKKKGEREGRCSVRNKTRSARRRQRWMEITLTLFVHSPPFHRAKGVFGGI